MNLQAYLDRIKFKGMPRPDLATLRAIHRGHLSSIPYENLDVAMGQRVSIDISPIFDKIVTRRRGGWCYEMNGLLAWALEDIGFKVTRMAGGVMRVAAGDANLGNHLVLRVDLDRPYLADVGFGDGMLEPVPIVEHTFRHDFLDYRLEDLRDGWWRFHNHLLGGAPSFDFEMKPAERALLADKCEWLQTSPDSPFVLNAVAQRHAPNRLSMMRGKTLKVLTPAGLSAREIGSAEEYVATLATVFDLELPEAANLWPKILARHEALFGAQGAASANQVA